MDVMTGCGLARADEHRRLLGGPQEHRVEEAFRAGALARGYSLDVIDEVWATLAAFGSFGFCKAHGAAFAVPTYHSAWLKTHHPEAFMAAILEHDPGMYPARLMVAEARRMGIPVLPVDVNASSRHVRVEWVPWHPELDGPPAEDAGAGGGEPGDVVARPHAEGGAEADLAEGAGRGPGRWGIRLPLTGLSGLSEAETERLDAGRPYRSLADVRDRARPTARNLERLAQLGALDCLLPAGAPRARTWSTTSSSSTPPPAGPVPVVPPRARGPPAPARWTASSPWTCRTPSWPPSPRSSRTRPSRPGSAPSSSSPPWTSRPT